MQREAAAGYYSCMLGFGPLPFAFTAVPPERFEVQQLPDSPR
jgi:hypothetical protein